MSMANTIAQTPVPADELSTPRTGSPAFSAEVFLAQVYPLRHPFWVSVITLFATMSWLLWSMDSASLFTVGRFVLQIGGALLIFVAIASLCLKLQGRVPGQPKTVDCFRGFTQLTVDASGIHVSGFADLAWCELVSFERVPDSGSCFVLSTVYGYELQVFNHQREFEPVIWHYFQPAAQRSQEDRLQVGSSGARQQEGR